MSLFGYFHIKMNVSVLFYIGFLVISVILYYYLSFKKNAIVCLTRGYDDIVKYDDLVRRNQCLYEKYYRGLCGRELQYDVVIFHEGNITLEQQAYIQSATPFMPLIFRVVAFYSESPINMSLCPPTKLSEGFSNGYKNICYFWSVDFLEYLRDYDYIIRVDEDCFLEDVPVDMVEDYSKRGIVFSSGYFQGVDYADVTVGMNLFFSSMIGRAFSSKTIRCPYTNCMIVSVPYFRRNREVMHVLKEIKKTGCIFSNRWGDLPIWGHILALLVDPSHYLEDKRIRYFHGSHNLRVNM
jgi:hypothetical protein